MPGDRDPHRLIGPAAAPAAPAPNPVSGDEGAPVPSTDGVVLAVHDLGGAGPPALLVHANGFHARAWLPFAGHLAGWHRIAPDLRGHGHSPAPATRALDWDGYADDVLAVVDALDLGDAVGIGHSMGGAALLRAEARRPGTFRALWCYEPIVFPPAAARSPGEPNPLAEGALRRRAEFASYDAAVANYSSKPPLDVFTAEALAAYVHHGFAPTSAGTVTLRCRPEVEAENFRMGTAHDTFERLPEIAIPVVVAAGSIDQGGPAAIAGAVADALPHGRLHRFAHLGHFGPMQAPQELALDAARALQQP